MEKKFAHVLTNTHWDREWYMSHEKYLVRLVSLMDRLMTIMEKDPAFIFICDGQFSMVDDYLSVRPEKTEQLTSYVKEGRLEVGPWFTQPLETLVSGEAMIRNLHYGIEGSERLGRAMRFSYEIDEFGHASQTPQILRGFGIAGALAWRGVPYACRSAFEWAAPDGSTVVMLNTNGGYGEATALPMQDEDYDDVIDFSTVRRAGLESRVRQIMNLRVPRSDSDHLLWLNGIDHSFVQSNLSEVLAKINEKYPEIEAKQSTCEEYFDAVRNDLAAKEIAMARVEGEMMWTAESILESTHACHPRQKQRHYRAERYLERYMEPTAALAWLAGFDARMWAQKRAWKYVLQNHAHDTLGCTSVDDVFEQAQARSGSAISLSAQVTEDCRRDVMSRLAEEQSLVVFNTSAFVAEGVFTFGLDVPKGYGGENFALQDENGNTIPVVLTEKSDAIDVRFNPKHGHPTATPAKRMQALAEIPPVPPMGWRRFRLVPNGTRTYYGNRRTFYHSPAPGVMENEALRCVIRQNGTVDLTDKATGHTYPSQFLFEDNGDAENMYVHIPPFENRTVYSVGAAADVVMLYDTPLGCAYEIGLSLTVPDGAVGAARRSSHTVAIPVTIRLTLLKDARRLDAEITVTNRAREHRLRVLFPTYLTDAAVSRGGQPFDVVERPISGPANDPNTYEQPYTTHPMQDICDVTGTDCGLTVAAEGIYEYECIDVESRPLALTLLRSIDRIYATWSIHPEEAENLTTITYKLSLLPHGGDWRESYAAAITSLAKPVFTLNRAPEESVLTDYVPAARTLPDVGAAVTLVGDNLILTAVKKSYRGESLIVRALNMGTETANGMLSLAFPGMTVAEAYETDLDECRKQKVEVENGGIAFTLRRAGLVTFELVLRAE